MLPLAGAGVRRDLVPHSAASTFPPPPAALGSVTLGAWTNPSYFADHEQKNRGLSHLGLPRFVRWVLAG